MDENIEESVVEETEADLAESSDSGNDSWDSLWDEESTSTYDDDDEPAEETDSDQMTESSDDSTDSETDTEENTEEPDADQYLELKHFDEVRKVGKEEAKELAQKGMDYDRIRGKLDESSKELQELRTYKQFLENIKGDFDTIEDLMIDTNARMMVDAEAKKGNSITLDSARDYARSLAQQRKMEPQNQQSTIEAIRQDSLTRFREVYPDVAAKDIPTEVWQDMNRTNSLVASYALYINKKNNEELETLRKNNENRTRSTGSMKSMGTSKQSMLDKIWDEVTW